MASISPKTDASVPIPSEAESPSKERRFRYPVYLSSCRDAGGKFASRLHDALQTKKIETFMDDRDTSGNASYPTLKATMEDSLIAIIVLSGKYADSTRSLDELAMICECMYPLSKVYPVFDQVEPTDVKYQKGSFEEAFTKHEHSGLYGSEKLNQWRDALRFVGGKPLYEWQYRKGFSLSVPRIVKSVFHQLQFHPQINTVNNKIIFRPTRLATIGVETGISLESAASLPSSAEPSAKTRRLKYDVFFSFRGDHWVNDLVSSTNHLLRERGFKTYIDYQLSAGNSVPSTSLQAIEESRFAIILLSEGYADLGCRLEELAKICECMKDKSRILSVFIDVDPNDVKYQMGNFEQAMTKHQNREQSVKIKVYQWRDALRKVGSFSGFIISMNNEYRAAYYAGIIVQSVCTKLQPVVYSKKKKEKLQPVAKTNTGDLDSFEATRQATVELEPSIPESNENVEAAKVIRQAATEIEPTMPKSTKNFEAVEATPRATDGNSSQFFGGPAEPSPQWKHDVFLSFSGKDIRKGFLSHLYHELQTTKKIRIFKDDEQLKKGKDISQSLLQAIQESRFAIIVLSEHYAFSAWCLDELTKIFQCMEGKDTILPIFYNVDPSDVRYQKNTYDTAFEKHESNARHGIDKVQQWRADLTKVGNLFGWDLNKYKSERELIEDIVIFVLKSQDKPLLKLSLQCQSFPKILKQ